MIPCGDIILLHDIGKESWMSVNDRLLEHRAADVDDLAKKVSHNNIEKFFFEKKSSLGKFRLHELAYKIHQ